ncbi:hypothetical protein ACH4F6_32940 [Streptomyces sp. NPDC017936]|uniref:hypothetical protein n=1 Tax=Streptomyces sp. NPDC017936 TaxID=3365016 RepID=UPI0037B9B735
MVRGAAPAVFKNPHHGGVFQITALPNTTPGTYQATVRIDYEGDTRLADNVFTIPVNVVVPAPVSDETDLTTRQTPPAGQAR